MFNTVKNKTIDEIFNYLNKNYQKIALVLGILMLLIVFKIAFFIVIFFLLDFLVSYVDLKYKIDLMFDFNPIGLIIFCYTFTYKYAYLFAFMMFIPRIITGKIEARHLLKFPVLVILGYLAYFFNGVNIMLLGSVLFILRYILEYSISFAISGTIDTSRIIRRIGHLIAAFVFFTYFAPFLINYLK